MLNDILQLQYKNFGKLEIIFMKNYNKKLSSLNIDNFIFESQKAIRSINYNIQKDIFYNDELNWEIGDLYIWITKMFANYKNTKKGYITNKFEESYKNGKKFYFCALCKKTLSMFIKNRIKINNAKKNVTNNIYIDDMHENDYQFIAKDNLIDIITKINFKQFLKSLNEDESVIFSYLLTYIYKFNIPIDSKTLLKLINIKQKRYYYLISTINKKLKKFEEVSDEQ